MPDNVTSGMLYRQFLFLMVFAAKTVAGKRGDYKRKKACLVVCGTNSLVIQRRAPQEKRKPVAAENHSGFPPKCENI